MIKENKKAQVWLETVIYTMIGLSLIAIVLSFIMPKINQTKERSIVEQSISSLQEIDKKINEIMNSGNGNRRNVEITLKRGDLYLDIKGKAIGIRLSDMEQAYSEPGSVIKMGTVNLLTTKKSRTYVIELNMSYMYNFSYFDDQKAEIKEFSASAIPYRLSFENKNNEVIEIKEISRG